MLGTPVQQVDCRLVPRFPFGNGQRLCRWIFKALDQGMNQLIRILCLFWIFLAMDQCHQLALKLLKQRWLNFDLIGCLPAFHQ